MLKAHVPRSISAIFPASDPAGSGSQARLEPPTAATGTYGPPTTAVIGAPKAAGWNGLSFSSSGTSPGPVTSTKLAKIVWPVVEAPTLMTFSAKPGDPAVAGSGPALPAE